MRSPRAASWYLACRDRLLAEGIDLTAYSTAENTADARAKKESV
jgi:hypothetical protein